MPLPCIPALLSDAPHNWTDSPHTTSNAHSLVSPSINPQVNSSSSSSTSSSSSSSTSSSSCSSSSSSRTPYHQQSHTSPYPSPTSINSLPSFFRHTDFSSIPMGSEWDPSVLICRYVATTLMVYWINCLMYWIHPNSNLNPNSDCDFSPNLNLNPNL